MLTHWHRAMMGTALWAIACGCELQDAAPVQPAPSVQSQVERGKYITDHVAMCTDCHTPRDEQGVALAEQWLRGAQLEFQPVQPTPMWAGFAPPIAGLLIYSPEHVVTLLTTGARPDGSRCRPPMPAYQMTEEDAEAVVAYLKSLGSR